MDYQHKQVDGNDYVLEGVSCFSLEETLDCGQCFRWRKEREGRFTGVVHNRILTVEQQGDCIRFLQVNEADFHAVWQEYFDLSRNYGTIQQLLRTHTAMAQAVDFCPGIRVLRQEPWEALCSFIISQNNHIPRIKGIIERLCTGFGEELAEGLYSFPTPERLAALPEDALREIRAGFRAKYILDAAKKVADGSIVLEKLYSLPLDEAKQELMQVRGVGPKVAACALLYGFGRVECMPVDVWIGRALEQSFPDGFPEAFAPVAGIAQQYLFHYSRMHMR